MTIADSPYGATMGFILHRDAASGLTIEMPATVAHRGRPGYIHGGALSGLLETAAYQTLTDALATTDGVRMKPVNVTVSFMRGATLQTSFASAKIERLGKRMANVEAVAWQEDREKPVAMAQFNILLVRD